MPPPQKPPSRRPNPKDAQKPGGAAAGAPLDRTFVRSPKPEPVTDPEEGVQTSDRLPAYRDAQEEGTDAQGEAFRPDQEDEAEAEDEDSEASKRTSPKPSPYPQDWDAPPGEMTGGKGADPVEAAYETGAHYPPEGDRHGTSDDIPAAKPGEDIYGENDELYGDDEDVPIVKPARGSETRIAPLDEISDEPSGSDEEDGEASPEKTHAGPPVKLEVISGPDSGKKKRFNGVRMLVGRVSDCDFALSDQSVSRHHLELVHGEKGVLLRDLGSGNGTKVNGEKVSERVLKHGDEISIGKTRFRFVDEVAALRLAEEERERQEKAKAEAAAAPAPSGEKPAEAPPAEVAAESQLAVKTQERAVPAALQRRSRKKGWAGLAPKQRAGVYAAGGVFAVLIFIIIALARRPPPAPPVDARETQAAEKMQLARSAARAERFEEALDLIEQAEKLKPGIDITDLKPVVQKEAEVQKGMDRVRGLLGEGKLDEAASAMAALPEPTSAKRTEERDALNTLLGDKRVEALANSFDAALAQRDLPGAQAVLDRLPPERQPPLAAKLQQAKAEAEQEKRTELHQAAAAREAAKKRSKAERDTLIDQAFAGVARKFHGGEFSRAVLECDRVAEEYRGDADIRQRSQELKRLIPAFQRSFDDGQKKYKANALESAARPLRKARDLYQQIRFPGALGTIIDEELAAAALGAGKAAQARGDLGTAAIAYREALQLNSSEEGAKEGLTRLARAAEDLYLEAYMIRDRDPREALAKLRVVLQVAPPGSMLREKADKQVQMLTPQ